MKTSLSFWFGVALVIMSVWAFGNSAEMGRAQESAKKDEKRFTMEFEKAAWKEVILWYVDKTKLPYASKWRAPPGAFTHSTPKGQTYTIHDVTVIINESLMKEGYVLVPRLQSTTLVKIEK